MTCTAIEELLPAYLDDDLPDDDRTRVEEHLDGCPFCQAFLHDLRRVEAWASAWPSLPREMHARVGGIDARVGRRLRREQSGSADATRRVLGFAGSAVAIVLILVLGAITLMLGHGVVEDRRAHPPHLIAALPSPTSTPVRPVGLRVDQLPKAPLAGLRPSPTRLAPPRPETLPAPISAAWATPTPASPPSLPAPVVSLAIDPIRGQTVYALLETNELDRSDDGGQAWRRLPFPAAITGASSIQSIPQHPDDASVVPQHDVVVPVGQPQLVLVVANHVLYRSDDRGTTWKALIDAVYAWTIADPNGETLYAWHEPGALSGTAASTEQGLYRSDDGGVTWTEVYGGAFPPTLGNRGCPCAHEGISTLLADPRDPARLYAGTDFGVLTSADGGKTWQKLDSGLPPTQRPYRWTPILAAGPDGSIYAVDEVFSDPTTATAELARLRPGGSIWTTVGSSALAQIQDPTDASHGIKTLVADPRRPGDLYLGTTQGLLATRDGGATWRKATIDGVHAVYHIALVPPSPGVPTTGSSARLYLWTDVGFRVWDRPSSP